MLSEVTGAIPASTAVLLSVLLVLFASWLWSASRTPGPWGLPILGYYPFLRKDAHVQLHELSKKYGEVYVINVLGQSFLYLGSMRALREAHVTKSEHFLNRPKSHSLLYATMSEGLIYDAGEKWRVQRKFFVQAMREIGVTPKKSEQKRSIENAIFETLEKCHDQRCEPFEILPILKKQCAAVILNLTLGDDISEEEVDKMNEEYYKVIEPLIMASPLLLGNIARWFVFPRLPGYKQMLISSKEMKSILNKILQRHKNSFDVQEPPKDIIDMYLRERELREKKHDPQVKYFTDSTLISTLEQIYGDGSLTIAIFISSFYFHISRYESAQDSVHEEIVRVVGTERYPSWEDRKHLPLTYSVILEHMRIANFIRLFIDTECARETTVLGVKVPKGSVTALNMWAINNNPEIYKNPETFDATRFLPENKIEPPLIFGVGKRACIGENLVMTELFLFISATLQNFKILPDSAPEASSDVLTLYPEIPFDGRLRFVPRPGSRYIK